LPALGSAEYGVDMGQLRTVKTLDLVS
jgi:hypothetical protein